MLDARYRRPLVWVQQAARVLSIWGVLQVSLELLSRQDSVSGFPVQEQPPTVKPLTFLRLQGLAAMVWPLEMVKAEFPLG